MNARGISGKIANQTLFEAQGSLLKDQAKRKLDMQNEYAANIRGKTMQNLYSDNISNDIAVDYFTYCPQGILGYKNQYFSKMKASKSFHNLK